MVEYVKSSLTWRLLAALFAWLSEGPLGRLARRGRAWVGASATGRFLVRWFTAPSYVGRSGFRRSLDGCNRLLHRLLGGFGRLAQQSGIARLYRGLCRYGAQSWLLGWMFSRGVVGVLLTVIGCYALVDYLLRDIFQLAALSSVWDEGLMLVCFGWIVFERIKAPRALPSRANAMDLYLGGYMLVGLVLLLYTSGAWLSINITGWRASMQYILLFFIVTRLLRDEGDFRLVYHVMVATALILALYGIWQYVVGVEIPANWTDRAEQSVRTRAFAIFTNPNVLGTYMVLFAPMTIGLAYTAKTPGRKIFWWVCGICMCLACLFTMSRGAWLALAVAAVLFALLVDRRLFALICCAGVVACFLPFVRSRLGYLFTQEFQESNARAGRGKRWATALGYLDDYDAWTGGLGYGMYGGAVATQNQINQYFEYSYVDNYYVKILVENGIVGLTTFVTSMVVLLYNGLRSVCRAARAGNGPLGAGMLAGLVGVLIHSFFESLWEEPYIMALFFAVAGMLIFLGFFMEKEEA